MAMVWAAVGPEAGAEAGSWGNVLLTPEGVV